MATSLSDLPTEILDLILERLTAAEFRALCQVSRSLHRIAEPRLYSKLDWTWRFGWDRLLKPPFPINFDEPPLVPFMRTIAHRPSLAAFVQTIELRGDDLSRTPHHFRGRHPCLSLRAFDVSEVVGLVDYNGVPDRDWWIQELRRGTVDAFVALLLAQVPNLKSLRLDENFLRDGALTAMVLRSSALANVASTPTFPFPSAGLSRLQRFHLNLSLDHRYRNHSRNTADVLSMFYVPSAQHLALSIDNPVKFSWPTASPPCPATLTSLDLSMLDVKHLGHILSVTKNLLTLRWEWLACSRDNEDASVLDTDTVTLDLDTIMAALWHVRETLANLTIQARWYNGGHQWVDHPALEVQGSFLPLATGLPMLTRLEVPLVFLTRSNWPRDMHDIAPSLPRGVEALTISVNNLSLHHDWEYSGNSPEGVIEEWWDNRLALTPRLRRFHLACDDDDLISEEMRATYWLDF